MGKVTGQSQRSEDQSKKIKTQAKRKKLSKTKRRE